MSLAALWITILAGPLVWLVYLQTNYMLVPWACHSGQKSVLIVTTVITLVLTLGTAFVGWREWHKSGATSGTEEGNAIGRSRFMALAGLGIAALFTLLVTASFIPILVLGACD